MASIGAVKLPSATTTVSAANLPFVGDDASDLAAAGLDPVDLLAEAELHAVRCAGCGQPLAELVGITDLVALEVERAGQGRLRLVERRLELDAAVRCDARVSEAVLRQEGTGALALSSASFDR